MLKQHIILEGPDGTGKSALVAEMNRLLEDKGFTVITCKNPSSPELYKQMHDNVLTPFQIAMSTLADMYTDFKTKILKYRDRENIVILQDRSALISSQIYNLPKMDYYEYDIWFCCANDIFFQYYRSNTQFVILTNNPHKTENNIFIDENNATRYSNLIKSGGEFWQAFLPFSSEGNITESARELLEELGYDT